MRNVHVPVNFQLFQYYTLLEREKRRKEKKARSFIFCGNLRGEMGLEEYNKPYALS